MVFLVFLREADFFFEFFLLGAFFLEVLRFGAFFFEVVLRLGSPFAFRSAARAAFTISFRARGVRRDGFSGCAKGRPSPSAL